MNIEEKINILRMENGYKLTNHTTDENKIKLMDLSEALMRNKEHFIYRDMFSSYKSLYNKSEQFAIDLIQCHYKNLEYTYDKCRFSDELDRSIHYGIIDWDARVFNNFLNDAKEILIIIDRIKNEFNVKINMFLSEITEVYQVKYIYNNIKENENLRDCDVYFEDMSVNKLKSF